MKKRAFMIVALVCTLFVGKQAAAAETATLRVISTTDIHSQVSSENYELAGTSNRSLAKLSTMIQTARAEVTDGCSITVDVGDDVFGYGAEVIMGSTSEPNDSLQPVFEAMSKIGYDAITLGNHDFDYGYTYIKNQLDLAGLTEACVVANVKEWGTGQYPWQQTKMLTREVKTSDGNTVTIQIGVVGVTYASLSGIYDYDGILEGESILQTVRTQSALLKQQGADVVVVLAHCGMGTESVTDSSTDVGYALSLIDDVDCVMLGHQHRNYPSDDANAASFYTLEGVDAKTGLINGKPVVMVADHAAGIGIADLTLEITEEGVTVVGAKTEVRKSSVLVKEDSEIASVTDTYDSLIKDTYDEILATVADDVSITGYFGLLEDNYAIQLNNEAKIRFGLNFINSKSGEAYADCPVIAATEYYMDGSEGTGDYIDVGSTFTLKDVLNTQEYQHNDNYAYWMTGAQLREWLEWSASIFAQQEETISSDQVLAALMDEYNASSLISEDWLDDWGMYTIFDGVEYEIDASALARYDFDGNLIHADSNRIVSLTCNGEEVTDDEIFIFVYHNITKSLPVIGEIRDQRLTKREYRSAYYMKKYVEELGSFGELTDDADNNWSVSFGSSVLGILRTSPLSTVYATLKSWWKQTLSVTESFAYYLVDLSDNGEEDTDDPLLVLCPSVTLETSRDVQIYVQASDASGIRQIDYLEGQYEEGDDAWEASTVLTGSAITVTENSVYSVRATDAYGNETIKHLAVTNINREILQIPSVDNVTNKKKYVTGEAEAGVTVHVQVGSSKYTTTAATDGSFSCKVGKKKAGKKVTVYVSDNEGRVSDKVKTTVLRRGPNAPSLDTVTNKSVTVSGKVNDDYSTVMVYIGKKVYVAGEDAEEIYQSCTKYKKNKEVVSAVEYTVEDDQYNIEIPVQSSSTTIRVFAADDLGRCSLVTKKDTQEEAPNQPQVNAICDVERVVSGQIPLATKKCTVTVETDSEIYTAKSDTDGEFTVKTRGFAAGTVVTVTASDTKNGQTRTSVSTQCVVEAESDYITSEDTSRISVDEVSTRTTEITGTIASTGYAYITYGEICAQLDLNTDGSFSYTLTKPLSDGTKIYVSCHGTSGETEEVKALTVVTKKPKKPTTAKSLITNKATTLKVFSEEKATVLVKTGNKETTVEQCTYNKNKKLYVYRVKIKKGTEKIYCYVENTVGTSKATAVKRKAAKSKKKNKK